MQIKKNIDQPNPGLPASGAAMDTVVQRRRGKTIAIAVVSVLAVAAAGYALWSWMPRGLQIEGPTCASARPRAASSSMKSSWAPTPSRLIP